MRSSNRPRAALMVVGGLGLENPRVLILVEEIAGICSAGSSWEKNEGENVREKVAAVFRHRSSAPKLKSCIICASHLYKNCISKKPLPISVRILGSKMQVSRDLELQSSTKIWLSLKIQRCARNEFLQIQRCYSFLAIVGLRI